MPVFLSGRRRGNAFESRHPGTSPRHPRRVPPRRLQARAGERSALTSRAWQDQVNGRGWRRWKWEARRLTIMTDRTGLDPAGQRHLETPLFFLTGAIYHPCNVTRTLSRHPVKEKKCTKSLLRRVLGSLETCYGTGCGPSPTNGCRNTTASSSRREPQPLFARFRPPGFPLACGEGIFSLTGCYERDGALNKTRHSQRT